MAKTVKMKKKHLGIFLIFLLAGFIGVVALNYRTPHASQKLTRTASTHPSPTPKTKPITDLGAFLSSFSSSPNQKEKDDFRTQVNNQAVSATTIELKNCKPSPLISRVKSEKPLTIKNLDSKEHTLKITDKDVYTIEAKGTLSITPHFEKGLGIYDYSCDDSTSPVGLFYTVSG